MSAYAGFVFSCFSMQTCTRWMPFRCYLMFLCFKTHIKTSALIDRWIGRVSNLVEVCNRMLDILRKLKVLSDLNFEHIL